MAAHARKPRGVHGLAGAARRAWRGWRRSRPFWGAVIIMAAGAEIAAVRFSLPVNNPRTIVPAGVLIAVGLVVCGLLLLFDPVQRSAYAIVAILLAISALTTSHLGGYLVGTLLGAAGGATAFAWVPGMQPPSPARSAPAGPQGFTLILGEADGRAERPDRD
jgi:4-amino-4-deoxy-L-arabinose transferase-like glycosyltransferase